MFTVKKRFEVNSHEVMDFVRLIGRFGLKFKVSDEYCVKDENDKTVSHHRYFTVYGTRKQISEFLEARDIIAEYYKH